MSSLTPAFFNSSGLNWRCVVEAGWQAVQPFLDAWKKAGADGLVGYEAGSEGPSEADDLLARDGNQWRDLT